MSKSRKPSSVPGGIAADRASQHDRRTEMVKDMVAKENAALDAKTARLRALRLAKESEEAAVPPAPKAPAKPRSRVKRVHSS